MSDINSNIDSSLADYIYDLPSELIAQTPPDVRHESRLISVDREAGSFSHHRFADIENLLKPGDVIVANDTKVLAARLIARRQTLQYGSLAILL